MSQWPYRVSEMLLPILKVEVELMLSLGVREESISEWSSPIVCIDFHKIKLRHQL